MVKMCAKFDEDAHNSFFFLCLDGPSVKDACMHILTEPEKSHYFPYAMLCRYNAPPPGSKSDLESPTCKGKVIRYSMCFSVPNLKSVDF